MRDVPVMVELVIIKEYMYSRLSIIRISRVFYSSYVFGRPPLVRTPMVGMPDGPDYFSVMRYQCAPGFSQSKTTGVFSVCCLHVYKCGVL